MLFVVTCLPYRSLYLCHCFTALRIWQLIKDNQIGADSRSEDKLRFKPAYTPINYNNGRVCHARTHANAPLAWVLPLPLAVPFASLFFSLSSFSGSRLFNQRHIVYLGVGANVCFILKAFWLKKKKYSHNLSVSVYSTAVVISKKPADRHRRLCALVTR